MVQDVNPVPLSSSIPIQVECHCDPVTKLNGKLSRSVLRHFPMQYKVLIKKCLTFVEYGVKIQVDLDCNNARGSNNHSL